MKELLKRVLVAAIGIPLALLLIYLGSYYFFGAILIISSIGLWEFFSLAKAKGWFPLVFEGIFTLVIIESTFFVALSTTSIFDFIKFSAAAVIEIFVFFIILFALNLFKNKDNAIANISTTFTGIFYVLIPFVSLLSIRYMQWTLPDRAIPDFILTYFASIWICDTAAYFIGKKWGKHKIAPSVSPKKSWEGGIAGLIASPIAFWLLGAFAFHIPFNPLWFIVFGLITGSLGQIGDFLESSFKRDANVKDSSHLLSEHGGVLDRFDSIMFTAPAILILLLFLAT